MSPDNGDLLEFRIKPRAATQERRRLTPVEKAERAAARAAAKLAKARAAEKTETPPTPAVPVPSTQ